MPHRSCNCPPAEPEHRRERDGFGSEVSKHLAFTVIGLLCTLIGTGIVSSITMYVKVSTLTEAQTRTEQSLQRHLDNSIDRDSYMRRDAAIQKQLDAKAGTEEVQELKTQFEKALDKMATKDDLRDQMRTLQTIQETIITRTAGHNGSR
jgi:hypothetical protein